MHKTSLSTALFLFYKKLAEKKQKMAVDAISSKIQYVVAKHWKSL